MRKHIEHRAEDETKKCHEDHEEDDLDELLHRR